MRPERRPYAGSAFISHAPSGFRRNRASEASARHRERSAARKPERNATKLEGPKRRAPRAARSRAYCGKLVSPQTRHGSVRTTRVAHAFDCNVLDERCVRPADFRSVRLHWQAATFRLEAESAFEHRHRLTFSVCIKRLRLEPPYVKTRTHPYLGDLGRRRMAIAEVPESWKYLWLPGRLAASSARVGGCWAAVRAGATICRTHPGLCRTLPGGSSWFISDQNTSQSRATETFPEPYFSPARGNRITPSGQTAGQERTTASANRLEKCTEVSQDDPWTDRRRPRSPLPTCSAPPSAASFFTTAHPWGTFGLMAGVPAIVAGQIGRRLWSQQNRSERLPAQRGSKTPPAAIRLAP